MIFVDEWQKLFLKKDETKLYKMLPAYSAGVYRSHIFSILSFLGSGRETNNLDDKWSSSFVGHCSNKNYKSSKGGSESSWISIRRCGPGAI